MTQWNHQAGRILPTPRRTDEGGNEKDVGESSQLHLWVETLALHLLVCF